MKVAIEETYNNSKEALNSIYKKRKRTLLFQKIVWGITGVYFIFIILSFIYPLIPSLKNGYIKQTIQHPYQNQLFIIGLIIIISISSIFFVRTFKIYVINEQKVMDKLIKSLFPNIEFSRGISDPIKEIEHSKLFTNIQSNPISYGQIRSTIGGYTINISDIGVQEKNVTNNVLKKLGNIPALNILVVLWQYSIKNTFTNSTIDTNQFTFRGMFSWFHFTKKLDGHTVLLTNNHQTQINRFFRTSFKEEQRILLEDPRFNKEFIVYGTNQIEARYVLSIALMERIITLKEKFNQPILLSFQNQQMYLAVQNKQGLFSFSKGKLDDICVIEKLSHTIQTALDIVSELKLKK